MVLLKPRRKRDGSMARDAPDRDEFQAAENSNARIQLCWRSGRQPLTQSPQAEISRRVSPRPSSVRSVPAGEPAAQVLVWSLVTDVITAYHRPESHCGGAGDLTCGTSAGWIALRHSRRRV